VSLDLLLCALPELLGVGSIAGLSAAIAVLNREVFGLETVGRLYGWLLFWMVAFQFAPVFFPRQSDPDWTAGVPNRALVASAAVVVEITAARDDRTVDSRGKSRFRIPGGRDQYQKAFLSAVDSAGSQMERVGRTSIE
jgi:hypothetical protein